MDPQALVGRARGGDLDAFTALVERYQRLAHGSAMTLVHDADLARDVTQESFLIAWRSLPTLLDTKAFAAWLRGIVRRHALHALRARRLESLVEPGDVPDERHSAEHALEASRRQELALAALAGLPDGLREAAVLRWVHDCSQAQIAAFLGLPVTTVNNRLHTARGRLKRRMLVMVRDPLASVASSAPRARSSRRGSSRRARPSCSARSSPPTRRGARSPCRSCSICPTAACGPWPVTRPPRWRRACRSPSRRTC
jgi:RNA polymerase sigma-70 factor (ECF subfamily)